MAHFTEQRRTVPPRGLVPRAAGEAVLHLLVYLAVVGAQLGQSFFLSFALSIPVVVAGYVALQGFLRVLEGRGHDWWRDRESVGYMLRPLRLLNLAFLGLISGVPLIPILVGWVVFSVVLYRVLATLKAGNRLSSSALERVALLTPFVPLMLFLFEISFLHDAFQLLTVAVSLVTDRDLHFWDEIFLLNYYGYYNTFAEESVRYLGVPVILSPVFLLVHAFLAATAGWGHGYPLNGFATPYLFSLALLTVVCGVLMALVNYRLARYYGARSFAILAAMGSLLASNALYFTVTMPGWSHIFGALFNSLFLLFWRSTLFRKGPREWLALGVFTGLLALLRPTNLFFCLPVVWEWIVLWKFRSDQRPRLLRSLTLAGAGALFVATLQNAAWWYIGGTPTAGPYKGVRDYFDFSSPHFWGVLFSVNHNGVFAWCPIYLLASLGLALLAFGGADSGLDAAKRSFGRLPTGRIYLVIALLHAYTYASWSSWWSNLGVGNRFFIELAPLVAVGFTVLLQRLSKVTMVGRYGAAPAVVLTSLLVFVNVALILMVRGSIVRFGIPGPDLVVEQPLSAATLGRHLLYDFPSQLRGILLRPAEGHPFFIERIVQSLSALNFAQLSFALALTAASIALVWGAVACAQRALTRPRRALRRCAGVLTVLIALWHVALGYAATRSVAVGRHWLVPGYQQELGSLRRTTEFWIECPFPISQFVLVGSLRESDELPFGTELGRVSVTDQDGREFVFSIAKDVDLGDEGSTRRTDRSGTNQMAGIVRAVDRVGPSRAFRPLLTFAMSRALPDAAVVRKVRIEFTGDRGKLVIDSLFLKDF